MQYLLTRALDESNYHAKREEFARTNPGSTIKRGMGFATFFHGSGFTGSGERRLNSRVNMDLTSDGRPRILALHPPEFSQGHQYHPFSGCGPRPFTPPYDDILIAQPDTAYVPNSGPTVASRTAMIVGKLVERCSQQLCATLVSSGYLNNEYSPAEFRMAGVAYLAEHGSLVASARYESPGDIFWDDDHYRGEAYPAYAWAVYVAEVAVDTTSYAATVTDFYALQEVWQSSPSHTRQGSDRRRCRPGHWLRALRKVCLAKRSHGQQPDDQLHHAHLRGRAPNPCSLRRDAYHPRSLRGQGNRRASDGRTRTGNPECHRRCYRAFRSREISTAGPEDIFERMTRTASSGSEDLDPATAGPYFSEATA